MDAPVDIVPSIEAPTISNDDAVPKAALTPPTSEDNDKREERLSSELSEIDSDDGEDIEPDHYFEGGKIPVFKPVCCRITTNDTQDGTSMRANAIALQTTMRTWQLTLCNVDNGPVPQLQALHR
jgi:hypothetical protein